MRILKRNLAFMLAMVMALSLTAFATGVEDYSDVNDITFVEAVDVMTEMGILEGTNGVFNPTGTLTREQGAKIIAYLMLGKSAADNMTVSVAPFNDVAANRWSAGYVAYCVDKGIIGGYGDGNFGPNDTLTATAFAKMLLSACGYGVNGEFTGAKWETEVNSLALKLGVFDGNLGANLGEGVAREEAALYAFNTLMEVETVKYSELMGAYYAGATFFDTESGTTLNEELYDYESKTKSDDFGRVGHVWLNAKNKEVTGVYVDDADATYKVNTKSGTIYSDLGLSSTTMATVIVDGEEVEDFQIKKNSTTKTAFGNGTLIEAYVDDDDNVTLIVINTYLAQVDADAEDGEVTVTVYGCEATTSETYETAVAYEEDEWVLVTYADGEIQSMVSAETVSGQLTASASSYIELDDTKMTKAANVDTDVFVTSDYDSTMTAVLDKYGYVIGLVVEEEADETVGYVYVVKSEAESDGESLLKGEQAVVKVLYLDGTGYEVLPMATKTVSGETKIQMTTGEGAAETLTYQYLTELPENMQPVVPGFYGYSMNDDDEIVLKHLNDTDAYEVAVLADANITADGSESQKIYFGATTKYMNSNTVLYVVTDEDVTTYEGYKNIEIEQTSAKENQVNALMVYSGSTAKEIYLVDGEILEDEIYAYYNGETKTNSDGTWVKLYIEGEGAWYLNETSSTLTQGINDIELDGDELETAAIATATHSTETGLYVTVAKSTYFKLSDGNSYTYADEYEVYDLTGTAAVAKNDKVAFVLNDDGLVSVVYIYDTYDKNATSNTVVTPETDAAEYTLEAGISSNKGTGEVAYIDLLDDGVVADGAAVTVKAFGLIEGEYAYAGDAKWDADANCFYFTANYNTKYVFKMVVDGETIVSNDVMLTK